MIQGVSDFHSGWSFISNMFVLLTFFMKAFDLYGDLSKSYGNSYLDMILGKTSSF